MVIGEPHLHGRDGGYFWGEVRTQMRTWTLATSVMLIVLNSIPTFPCSAETLSPQTMVAKADLILRVTAVSDVLPVLPNSLRRLWNSNVRFSVQEVLKGQYERTTISLPGFLTDQDEWNRQMPPYRYARASADGACFTHGYRKGGQFLLMLKKWDGSVSEIMAGRPLDGYSVAWNPLGAVNEQLRLPDDPWVQWVRQQVKR